MKKAFLVGINDYPGSGNDLAGCVNDTANLRKLLLAPFGFEPANVRTLTDARATRAAIMDGLETLVRDAASGDVLVFQYSGHGAQVPDQDDDERADHLDEVLCPRDFSWDGVWIRDDDLSAVFGRLSKGAHLEVFLDSCHSGTGTREIAIVPPGRAMAAGIDAAVAGRGRKMARSRHLVPPASLAARVAALRRRGCPTRKVGSLAQASPRGLNHVLWAGCRSDQYSADADIGGTPNGAFTWHFCDACRTAGDGADRADLLTRVRRGLKDGGYEQTPQLECADRLRHGRLFEA